MTYVQDSENTQQDGEDESRRNAPTRGSTPTREGSQGNNYSYGLGDNGYQYLISDSSGSEENTVTPNTVSASATSSQAQQTEQIAEPDASQGDGCPTSKEAVDANIKYVETYSHGRRPLIFTDNFKFEPTLKKVFAKVDKDNDNRLSKAELIKAMAGGKFYDDEELLVCLLVRFIDNIRRFRTSKTYFDLRGVTWDDVIAYSQWEYYLPPESLEYATAAKFKRQNIKFSKKR
jgi:hypothetical protein